MQWLVFDENKIPFDTWLLVFDWQTEDWFEGRLVNDPDYGVSIETRDGDGHFWKIELFSHYMLIEKPSKMT